MIREIDRGMIMLCPKQVCVDWVNAYDPGDNPVSVDEACQDLDAFLVPEFESQEEAMAFVAFHTRELFEHVLEDWCLDRSLWPAQRDCSTLLNWFEVNLHCLVFDMAAETQSKPGLN